jgi:hypothetical protein
MLGLRPKIVVNKIQLPKPVCLDGSFSQFTIVQKYAVMFSRFCRYTTFK